MSDAVVPEVTDVPATTPASAPAEDKPSWLDARLERERAKVLKDLGVSSLDDAKKALAQIQAIEEEKKSDAQRRGELESTLKREREERQAMADALGAYAKSQMSALTEVQRNAVTMLAGEDPAKQLRAIETLSATWVSAPPAAPPPPPRDTAPAPAAPKDGGQPAAPDPKAIHEELQKTNPVLAARFALSNGLFSNK